MDCHCSLHLWMLLPKAEDQTYDSSCSESSVLNSTEGCLQDEYNSFGSSSGSTNQTLVGLGFCRLVSQLVGHLRLFKHQSQSVEFEDEFDLAGNPDKCAYGIRFFK